MQSYKNNNLFQFQHSWQEFRFTLQQKLFSWHRNSRRFLPGSCLLCLQVCRHKQDLCAACWDLVPKAQFSCQACAEPLISATASFCARCLQVRPAFNQALVPALYEPPYKNLIAQFKYGRQLVAGYLLLDLLLEAFNKPANLPTYNALLTMPEQQERTHERGYHAPSWLAQRFSWLTGIYWRKDWLVRIKNVPSQQSLSRKARWLNPQGAFQASPKVQGKNLLLLDDVITTGASAHWAAVELRALGAARVDVLACAKTAFSRMKS